MHEIHIKGSYTKPVTYELSQGRYKIGKAHDADIILYDSYVSSYHAELLITDKGLLLNDLNSTNGTWINNKLMTGPKHLYDGNSFSIGSSTLSITVKKNLSKRIQLNDKPKNLQSQRINISKLQEKSSDMGDLKIHLFRQKVHQLLLDNMDISKRELVHTLSADELKLEARKALRMVIDENILDIPVGKSEEDVITDIIAETIGFGPLEPLLSDESITEIMVNGPTTIYVEKNGEIAPINCTFSSAQSLINIIERIVTPLGRRIDEGSPMVDARLENGSRINAIIPPLSLNGPVLTIRKFSKNYFSMDDLIDSGTLSRGMALFLESCVINKKNIIVSGGTSSGKTTTLNVLSNFIPGNERIITIEDAAELRLKNEHVVSLESRPNNTEGSGLITIRDLVRNALRMRPDRIIIGECRGGEALDMMQAMNTGHEGSLTTGHANSARDFLSRLEIMILMSGYTLPIKAIREQIASSIDIIIQQVRTPGGKRRIVKITEIDGMEGDTILLQDIFAYTGNNQMHNGNKSGEFSGCGVVPSFYDELKVNGMALDRNIFHAH